MKFTICFLIIFMLVGCIAPRVQELSDVPAPDEHTKSVTPEWDKYAELDSIDDSASENAEDDNASVRDVIAEDDKTSVRDVIAEDDVGYHFRKTRWGFSRDRVELSEVGERVLARTSQAIVYQCKINGVNCHLIYTFGNNKLRTAGYITTTSVPYADNLRKAAVDKYGPPDGQEIYEEGANTGLMEMIWTTPDTLIFFNLYPDVTKQTRTVYDRTDGGLLKGLVEKQRSETQAGNITYYSAVHACIDKAFFYKLQEHRFPLDELSSYEKQLMGVTVKGKRTIIPGVGTIPQ